MSITLTKRQLQALADVMDGDHASLEDAVKAVAEKAVELYEDRAGWVVVGHLRWDKRRQMLGDVPRRGEDGSWIDESDWRDSRVVLGPFTTEKQAEEARKGLAVSTVTGEEFSTWVFPLWHGTPHAFFTSRKDAAKKAVQKLDTTAQAAHERALQRRIEWWELHGSESVLPDDIDDERDRCTKCGQLLEEGTSE